MQMVDAGRTRPTDVAGISATKSLSTRRLRSPTGHPPLSVLDTKLRLTHLESRVEVLLVLFPGMYCDLDAP